MSVPRSEYPRPQWVRRQWLCLNGKWDFQIDNPDSGIEKGLLNGKLNDKIIVPFCPESVLSGIGNVDFMKAVWYQREVEIPQDWNGRRILLHFQAVDYETTVWAGGVECGRHRGGWTPFTVELTDFVTPGESAKITVRARDDMKQTMPRGKQSAEYANHDCEYTRTTGIWQSVWLEPVPAVYLQRPRITPQVRSGSFIVEQSVTGNSAGMQIRVSLSDKKGNICTQTSDLENLNTAILSLMIPEDRKILWSPENPHLYDLEIELLDKNQNVVDSGKSYAGLRNITIDGKAVKINDKIVFQRLVLDQGYYPDGIMTAPDDEAMVKDIQISLDAGFNGARLHQKVFEERFLYHCDKMGYLVWAEFGDWGLRERALDSFYNQPGAAIISQWMQALRRDYSHPSIIGWCPLNETHQVIEDRYTSLDDITRALFWVTKSFDPTRPVIDASGYSHRVEQTDIYDSHLYVQDPELFKKMVSGLDKNEPFINNDSGGDINFDVGGNAVSAGYKGQPFFLSEFGGIWWNKEQAEKMQLSRERDRRDSWGYGEKPRSIDEFYSRFESLCNALLDDPDMFGYCYTQLTDVFQEQNGIYNFDRTPKFDLERISKIQKRKAAIELKT